MGYTILGSAEPKYLAATDILIGDMSNINYEFLLFERPVILLANEWVRKHFPDIGIKAELNELENAIQRSISNPDEFKSEREFWAFQTIFLPEGGASCNYIDIAIKNSGFNNPSFILIDGNNEVRKTNLLPLFNEIKLRGLNVELVHKYDALIYTNDEIIFIGAHFNDIKNIKEGYNVHIDHDLKGPSSANISQAKRDYKRNKYFPNIDLHIAAGFAGQIRTQYLLSQHDDKVIVGGYSKADDLLRLNSEDIKVDVCNELGLDPTKPLITYAPAGNRKFMKPGGSYNKQVVKMLKEFEIKSDINILIKVKYSKSKSVKEFILKVIKKLYSVVMRSLYSDSGYEWDAIIKQIIIKNNFIKS